MNGSLPNLRYQPTTQFSFRSKQNCWCSMKTQDAQRRFGLGDSRPETQNHRQMSHMGDTYPIASHGKSFGSQRSHLSNSESTPSELRDGFGLQTTHLSHQFQHFPPWNNSSLFIQDIIKLAIELNISFTYVPRSKKFKADFLAKSALSLSCIQQYRFESDLVK